MVDSWQSKLARTKPQQCRHPRLRHASRCSSSDALWTQTWFSVFPLQQPATSIFGSIRRCCRGWQSRAWCFPPYLFPAWWVPGSSQFCCNQLRRASNPLATSREPHRTARTFDGAVRFDQTAWRLSKSARPLVSGQCGCCDDLSERALVAIPT